MARAPFRATLGGGGGGKRALQRLINYWPLVPCLALLLWGYTDCRLDPHEPCCTLLWLSIPRCCGAASLERGLYAPPICLKRWAIGTVVTNVREAAVSAEQEQQCYMMLLLQMPQTYV